MATLTISLKEIADFLLANDYIPDYITHVVARRDGFTFTIRPKKRFLADIPAKATFVNYDHGYAHLQIVMRTFRGKIVDPIIDKILPKSKMPAYIKLKYPDMFIYINEMLVKRFKGATVEKMVLDSGMLTVTVRCGAVGSSTKSPGQEEA